MARPPRFNISALRDLLEQLRYAPSESRVREMQHAEALLAEIEPEQNYPEDYVIFRITSYRPSLEAPTMMVGKALIRDLAVFIERLSHALALPAERYAPRKPLSISEVADRLNVSLTTLHRYRRIGLVAHQIVDDDGERQLCIFEDALDRFVSRNLDRVERAGAFEHLSDVDKKQLFRRAQRYRRSLGWSITQVAGRLGTRFQRTPEAVRQLLRRHDADAPVEQRIFGPEKRLTDRDRSVIERAVARFIPIGRIARRIGCTPAAIYRIVNLNRAAHIRDWRINLHELPTYQRPDSTEVLLSVNVVQHNLIPDPPIGGDFVEWLESAQRSRPPLPQDSEVAWFGAMNYLLYLARTEREFLDEHHPSGSELDTIETHLRWASALKRRIISAHLPDGLKTIEIHLEHPLQTCTLAHIHALHELLIDVAARTVDEFNPTQRQRFSTAFLFQLRRALAAGTLAAGEHPTSTPSIPFSASAASARRKWARGSLWLNDYANRMNAWDKQLQLTSAERSAWESAALDDQLRDVIDRRFGLSGHAPRTCADIADERTVTAERVAAIEYRARRVLRLRRLNSWTDSD